MRFLDGKQTKVSIVDDLFVCIEGVYKIKCKNKMEAEKIYKTLLDWVSRKMRRVPVIPQGEHGYSSMYW